MIDYKRKETSILFEFVESFDDTMEMRDIVTSWHQL